MTTDRLSTTPGTPSGPGALVMPPVFLINLIISSPTFHSAFHGITEDTSNRRDLSDSTVGNRVDNVLSKKPLSRVSVSGGDQGLNLSVTSL